MKTMTTTSLASLTAALALIATSAAAAPFFEDVTSAAGVNYVGESWGASWGDFNGDGWPDVWTPNHGRQPTLLINQQDGTFVDVAEQVIPLDIWEGFLGPNGVYDAHGAVWVDIDRDGDQDLFQAADGGQRIQPDHLYLNDGGVAFAGEFAAAVGADGLGNDSTMPLPVDFNFDGLPDIIVAGVLVLPTARPVRFLEQVAGPTLQFNDVTDALAPVISSTGLSSATVADLDGDRDLEIGMGPAPDGLLVIERENGVFNDITQILGLDPFNARQDVVIADFDGDLDDDVFMVRGEALAEVLQVSDDRIEASIAVQTTERGFTFQTTGDISVGLYPSFQVNINDIYIGASGYQPTSRNFGLAADDPNNVGIMPHTPGAIRGYFIGLDPATDTWTVLISSGSYIARNVTVNAINDTLGNLQLVNIDAATLAPKEDVFLTNESGVFQYTGTTSGFAVPSSGRNIGAGDFDNDGDVDLYVVATGPVLNRPNLLYVNQGDGTFLIEPGHGAEGGSEGRGDAVAVADYDQDGFLDLFVTNGKSKPPFEADGVYNLFRNLGNANNWLQIDLEGVLSAPNGAGAAIHLTSGGVTQRRFANAGVHYRAQDFQRIHFGLGTDTTVDSIEVTWPSGVVQTLNAVAANQIISITEPSQSDQDGDGVDDSLDNCTLTANAAQTDTDGDLFGNHCDADFNNDCVVNTLDLGLFKAAFLSATELYDLNVDGVVNAIDLGLFKLQFFGTPGPSGAAGDCVAARPSSLSR